MSTWLVDGGALLATGWHAAHPDQAADTARRAFVHQLFRVLGQHRPSGLGVFFDAPPLALERKRALWPKWRADRPQKPRQFWEQVIDPLRRVIAALGASSWCFTGWDADDVISSVCANAPEEEHVTVLSRSQRLHQLLALDGVAFHDGAKFVSALEATAEDEIEPARLCELLAITGIRGDCLPGIQGVGPKTAAALLKGVSLAHVIERAKDPAWVLPGGEKGKRISADLRSEVVAAQVLLNFQVLRLAKNAPRAPFEDLALRPRDDQRLGEALRDIKMMRLASWVESAPDLDRWAEEPPPEGDKG